MIEETEGEICVRTRIKYASSMFRHLNEDQTWSSGEKCHEHRFSSVTGDNSSLFFSFSIYCCFCLSWQSLLTTWSRWLMPWHSWALKQKFRNKRLILWLTWKNCSRPTTKKKPLGHPPIGFLLLRHWIYVCRGNRLDCAHSHFASRSGIVREFEEWSEIKQIDWTSNRSVSIDSIRWHGWSVPSWDFSCSPLLVCGVIRASADGVDVDHLFWPLPSVLTSVWHCYSIVRISVCCWVIQPNRAR